MSVKVAINGFGRIGRLAFRQMFGAEGYEVVAINDLTSPEMLANLLKYDTAQGGYCGRIGENLHTVDFKAAEYEEDGKTVKVPGAIIVDGKEITIYAMPNAKDLPWGELDVMLFLSAPASTAPRRRARLTSTQARRRSLSPLPQAMTSRPSSSALTRTPSLPTTL